MKLTKDARIITVDGQDIGNLNRFVMDPKSKQVSHIVFETGLLSKEEHVVPMQFVDHVDDHGIHLRALPVDDIHELPVFEEESYVVSDEGVLLDKGYISDDTVSHYYYYPPAPFGADGILRPDDTLMGNPSTRSGGVTGPRIPVSGDQGFVHQVDQNIPDGTVALKEGAKVISSDSKHLGDIEKVFVDTESARATHLLITKGLLFKERKLVPVDWVDLVGEDEVYLSVNSSVTMKLPDYTG